MDRHRAISRRLAMIVSATVLLGLAPGLAETLDSAEGQAMTRMHVIVGDQTLPATLDDTPAGRSFAALLPLDLTLTDYHGIEKVADLPESLDTTGAPARYDPSVGDITLYAPWGNLAIFIQDFSASRGLVRLGAFDGPIDALAESGPVPAPARFERAD